MVSVEVGEGDTSGYKRSLEYIHVVEPAIAEENRPLSQPQQFHLRSICQVDMLNLFLNYY